MTDRRITWGLLAALFAAAASQSFGQEIAPIKVVQLTRGGPVLFDKDVQPILAKKCLVCHSAGVVEGDLNLSTHAALLKGGGRGPAVVPGNSAKSLLITAAGRTGEPLMPPPDAKRQPPLTPQELALIKRWIDQGVKPPTAKRPAIVAGPPSPAVRVVKAVAVRPDKSAVAVAQANRLYLYQPESGKLLREFVDLTLTYRDGTQTVSAAHLAVVDSLTFSPDGKRLASGAFGEIALWDASDGSLLHKISGFADRVTALDFSPDGKLLATGGGAATVDGEVTMFDAVSGKLILEIQENGHSDTVFGVRFSPDGQKLATCGADMAVKVFDASSGKLLKVFEGHTHHVLDVGWKPDGKMLASAGADKKVRLWDYATGEQLTKINRGGGRISTIWLDHETQVNRLLFIPKEPFRILTSSGTGGAQLWDVPYNERPGNYTTGYYRPRMQRQFAGPRDFLFAISASPDGALVATAGASGVVRIYNGLDGKLRTIAPGEHSAKP